MGRALVLLLLLSPALAQTASCEATEVAYDFSAPGPLEALTVGGAPHYVANLASYLLLLSGTSPCASSPPGWRGDGRAGGVRPRHPGPGRGRGRLCGAGNTWCFRVEGVTGSLPVPGDWTGRLYVMVQVVSGRAASHAPSPTLLSALPDRRGLASVGRGTTALLWIHYFLELSPADAFPSLPARGTLHLTYSLGND